MAHISSTVEYYDDEMGEYVEQASFMFTRKYSDDTIETTKIDTPPSDAMLIDELIKTFNRFLTSNGYAYAEVELKSK